MRAKILTEVIQDPQIWEMALQEYRENSSQKVFCKTTIYLQEEYKPTIGKKMKSIAPIVGLRAPMVSNNLRSYLSALLILRIGNSKDRTLNQDRCEMSDRAPRILNGVGLTIHMLHL
jgi:hypothetical protein